MNKLENYRPCAAAAPVTAKLLLLMLRDITDDRDQMRQLEAQLQGSEERRAALSQQYDSMRTWADMYGQCDMAAKKMIVARLMRAVRVSRDYQVEIELTVDCEQLGISLGSGDEATALLAA